MILDWWHGVDALQAVELGSGAWTVLPLKQNSIYSWQNPLVFGGLIEYFKRKLIFEGLYINWRVYSQFIVFISNLHSNGLNMGLEIFLFKHLFLQNFECKKIGL